MAVVEFVAARTWRCRITGNTIAMAAGVSAELGRAGQPAADGSGSCCCANGDPSRQSAWRRRLATPHGQATPSRIHATAARTAETPAEIGGKELRPLFACGGGGGRRRGRWGG